MRRGRSGRFCLRADGFSAVEVLVAASITAYALLAIAGMFPVAYTNADRSGEETTAVALAQQRIEFLKNQAYTSAALAAGTTSENSIGGYPGYTRTTVIQDDTPLIGVKRVTVTVNMPTVGKSVQLTALIAK